VSKLTIHAGEILGTVSPYIHGHFAEHLGRCCYDGLFVGLDSKIPNEGGFRTDVIQALKKVGIPQLRWPGGCFADSYHWRDGIGPVESRPRTWAESCGLNVVEDNTLGTHEFIALCKAIGADPYLAGNVGSGSAQELADWVHYCNGKADTTLARERAANGHPDPMNVKFWGVGNENWGCGGNYDAETYAKEFKRFGTFLKMADNSIQLVACGFNQRDWNMKLVETLRNNLDLLDHVSVHQYWANGHATDFTEDEYYGSMQAAPLCEELIQYTDEILSFFTAGRKKVGIAFDEWGIWHPEATTGTNYEAPSTIRDAVVAAGVLDVFQKWSRRITTANIAQVVNVLQALIQTSGEKMWVTPTYHLFALYAAHRGAQAVRTEIEAAPTREAKPSKHWSAELPKGAMSLLSASASKKDGQLIVSLSNRHKDEAQEVTIVVRDGTLHGGSLQTLAGAANAHNSADQPNAVGVTETTVNALGDTLTLSLPPCSVQTLVLKLA
jgi:alpha-N-arabinofuranosidase